MQLDADLTMPPDYFERLLAALDETERLGIVSGTCFELERGAWKERPVTPPHVWGAARAYRRECLLDVLPFEPRTGWDAIDVAQANAVGWQTAIIPGPPVLPPPERSVARARAVGGLVGPGTDLAFPRIPAVLHRPSGGLQSRLRSRRARAARRVCVGGGDTAFALLEAERRRVGAIRAAVTYGGATSGRKRYGAETRTPVGEDQGPSEARVQAPSAARM